MSSSAGAEFVGGYSRRFKEHKNVRNQSERPSKKCSRSRTKVIDHAQSNRQVEDVCESRRSFKCFTCNQIVANRKEMIDHIRTSHNKNIVKKSKDSRLECYSCGKRYRHKRGLIEHIRLRHPSQICSKFDFNAARNFECLHCGRKYSYKRGLLAHVKYRHPEIITKKLKNFVCELCNRKYSYARGLREHMKNRHIIAVEKSENLKSCESCNEKFVLAQSLSEHVKQKHSMIQNLDIINKHFICAICDKVYSSRRRIVNHIIKRHPSTIDSKSRPNKLFKCPTCLRLYNFRSSLSSHIRKKHPEKVLTCEICTLSFLRRTVLMRHLQKRHAIFPEEISSEENIRKPGLRICPICLTSYVKKAHILEHLSSAHNIKVLCESLRFNDGSGFHEWKCGMEVSTCSRYVLYNRYKSGACNITHYVCHRSGLFCTKRKGIRNSRRIGSKKMNSFCPAEIRLRFDTITHKYLVDFCGTHVGHDIRQLRELRFLGPVAKDVGCKLACLRSRTDAQLPMAAPKMLEPEEVDQVTQYVVCMRHNDDLENLPLSDKTLLAVDDVDRWVRENTDFVFYYKGAFVIDPNYPELDETDFVLAIMDECQLDVLKTFGSNVVAVDREDASFIGKGGCHLFTLSVIDELQLEFTCIYMFSTRADAFVYQLLFEKLKEHLGPLETRIFMSDVSEVCVNAWCAVMPPPERHLYCDQHVRRDWILELNCVTPLQKRYECRQFMLALKNELNPYHFHELLDAWMAKPDGDLLEFKSHFERKYAECAACWAHCYRKHAGVKDSMAANRFLVAARRKMLARNVHSLTLAQALNLLSETMQRFYSEKLQIEADAKLVPKMKHLRNKHSLAVKNSDILQFINQLTDMLWYVPLLDTEEDDENLVHRVEMVNETCGCDVRCELCDACLHTYVCSCFENCIEFNMCEHIHLVGLYRLQNESKQMLHEEMVVVSSEFENLIDELE